MIQSSTKLFVQDNSGGRLVECIRILKKSGRSTGSVGDFLLVSVKKLRKKGRIKVKKKEICIALITKVNKNILRQSGVFIRTSKNYCILFNRQYKSHGTRVFGSVIKELRDSNKLKLVLMASKFI
jgi:large subunit ribosomal protein L14